MLRLAVSATLAIALVVAIATSSPKSAFACSADPSFDPVAESDVILGGQITAWTPLTPTAERGMFVPVLLEMRIDHVWKGTVDASTRVVDETSLTLLPAIDDNGVVASGYRIIWAGASGACGALDKDPTGAYAVFGLAEQPDGSLRTNRLTTFYLDPAPYDPGTLARLDVLGLPATGGDHTNGSATPIAASGTAVASLLWGVVLVRFAISHRSSLVSG
jgi:hypothetical protein